MSTTPVLRSASFEVWSTTATVVVTEPASLGAAREVLDGVLADVDRAANRFRSDSEIARVNRGAGTEQLLSPLLDELVGTALQIARATGGLVDPTVGAAVIALGYDRDIARLRITDRELMMTVTAGAGRRPVGTSGVRRDRVGRRFLAPEGTWLDLGATAKAWAADRAATVAANALGCGVLVNLGGDIAAAGPAPRAGWRIAVGDDHLTAVDEGPVVVISSGGLATSSTAVRRWEGPQGVRHHVVDPRTGLNPVPVWRTVSATARTAVGANAATTAALVLAGDAPAWLAARAVPSRLVAESADVLTVGGWPADGERAVA